MIVCLFSGGDLVQRFNIDFPLSLCDAMVFDWCEEDPVNNYGFLFDEVVLYE